MSVEATSWAWKQPISGNEKLVLLAIADNADGDGICWPGRKGIAEKTGISTRTVTRVVKTLTGKGYIITESRTRKDGGMSSNRYILALGGVDNLSPPLDTDVQGPLDTGVHPPWTQLCPGHKYEPSLEPPFGRYTPEFETWWSVVSLKVEKEAAFRAFRKARKKAPLEKLIEAAGRYYAAARPPYVKHPTTWLNKGCWDDESMPISERPGPRDHGAELNAAFDHLEKTFAGTEP